MCLFIEISGSIIHTVIVLWVLVKQLIVDSYSEISGNMIHMKKDWY